MRSCGKHSITIRYKFSNLRRRARFRTAAAAERGHVFDRFYRLPGSGVEGSGLGLAIVKQIADAHGAQITLGEAHDGHGLKASVRFPVTA